MVEMEIGARYRTRDGRKTGKLKANDSAAYPFAAKIDGTIYTYTVNGKVRFGTEDENDLIEKLPPKVKKPAPTPDITETDRLYDMLTSPDYKKDDGLIRITNRTLMDEYGMIGNMVQTLLNEVRQLGKIWSTSAPDITESSAVARSDVIGETFVDVINTVYDNLNKKYRTPSPDHNAAPLDNNVALQEIIDAWRRKPNHEYRADLLLNDLINAIEGANPPSYDDLHMRGCANHNAALLAEVKKEINLWGSGNYGGEDFKEATEAVRNIHRLMEDFKPISCATEEMLKDSLKTAVDLKNGYLERATKAEVKLERVRRELEKDNVPGQKSFYFRILDNALGEDRPGPVAPTPQSDITAPVDPDIEKLLREGYLEMMKEESAPATSNNVVDNIINAEKLDPDMAKVLHDNSWEMMGETSARAESELLLCPWCGHKPQREAPFGKLVCRSNCCPIEGRAFQDMEWNTRARPPHEIASDIDELKLYAICLTYGDTYHPDKKAAFLKEISPYLRTQSPRVPNDKLVEGIMYEALKYAVKREELNLNDKTYEINEAFRTYLQSVLPPDAARGEVWIPGLPPKDRVNRFLLLTDYHSAVVCKWTHGQVVLTWTGEKITGEMMGKETHWMVVPDAPAPPAGEK